MVLLHPPHSSRIGPYLVFLEAASWRSNSVFTSFYFWDLQYIFEEVRSLGPFVASGERIG